jgi:hypothetical protein
MPFNVLPLTPAESEAPGAEINRQVEQSLHKKEYDPFQGQTLFYFNVHFEQN